MISKYLFTARLFARQLWVRAALITALAFLAPVLAPLIAGIFPDRFLSVIDQEQVRALLDILANSMLAVTTFSLTIMVTAHLAADQSASPRGHRLLREDGRTQTVLATFVGSFVFALVSIVLLQTEYLGKGAIGAYYFMTLLVFGIVIITILRWIGQLASLGSVEATIIRAEAAASDALRTRAAAPFLGGRRLNPNAIPEDAHTLHSPSGGYVRHIDTKNLSALLDEYSAEAYLEVLPGAFVHNGDALAQIDIEELSDDQVAELCSCFTFGKTRGFDQDPIFAISVMTEIAERALSPGINDPHTALDVATRLNLMLDEFDGENEPEDITAPLVHVPPLGLFDLVQNALEPIARDGSSNLEVQMHVQATLGRLAKHRSAAIAQAARIVSGRALAYAANGLLLEADRARVAAMAPAPLAASHSDEAPAT